MIYGIVESVVFHEKFGLFANLKCWVLQFVRLKFLVALFSISRPFGFWLIFNVFSVTICHTFLVCDP